MDIRTIEVGPLQANCHILGSNSAVVVDPGSDAQRIIEYIRLHNITVSSVLLTHAHFDHISGANALVKETGALVYIHALDAGALSDNYLNLSAPFGNPIEEVHFDMSVNEGDKIPCDDKVLEIWHTPGHTPGSICAYLIDGEDKILVSGDTLFQDAWGRTDFPGGSQLDMRASLQRLERQIPSGTRVLPGHGRIFTKE